MKTFFVCMCTLVSSFCIGFSLVYVNIISPKTVQMTVNEAKQCAFTDKAKRDLFLDSLIGIKPTQQR